MSNKLQSATSPYLYQHADNPVEWYPWGQEALTRAREEKKPILLSIGYSACHWCHVMAAESFSDPEIAALMNKYFINIKVDREERPDLDKIYQRAYQLLSQRAGGWPLTIFLTPEDHIPFFVGTYFPSHAHHGLPAFRDVLEKISGSYKEKQAEIRYQNQQVQKVLQTSFLRPLTPVLNEQPLTKAQQHFKGRLDPIHGGFKGAPKFPQATVLEYFLSVSSQCEEIYQHLQLTLKKMAQGGVFDQLGGGFFRYAVDDHWEIPHFEKMLYDNAQLLSVYSKAYSLARNPEWLSIINGIVQWVTREMRSPEGGFYSSLDADSEHTEGKFYYFDQDEIQQTVSVEEFAVLRKFFNLSEAPNFEGYWHLHYKKEPDLHNSILFIAKEKLLHYRNQRVRPTFDTKILTSWNALLIKGFALAYQATQEASYLDLAESTLLFIKQNMWRDNRLYACYSKGASYQEAFLDDYAYLLDALLILLQQRWKTSDLRFAQQLADYLLQHFKAERGGFYFTDELQEVLFYRLQLWHDEALPAGNGIAAYALQRLGYLLSEPRYLLGAEQTLHAAASHIAQYPTEHSSLLMALTEYLKPPKIIIIRGEISDIKKRQAVSLKNFNPHCLSYAIPNDAGELPAGLRSKAAHEQTTVYVCRGLQCEKKEGLL